MILAGNKDNYIVLNEFKFRPDLTTHTAELAALERLKKIPYLLSGDLVSTLEPAFLIGSFSFLQVTRTTIKACMSSDFSGIPSLTSELAALEC